MVRYQGAFVALVDTLVLKMKHLDSSLSKNGGGQESKNDGDQEYIRFPTTGGVPSQDWGKQTTAGKCLCCDRSVDCLCRPCLGLRGVEAEDSPTSSDESDAVSDDGVESSNIDFNKDQENDFVQFLRD